LRQASAVAAGDNLTWTIQFEFNAYEVNAMPKLFKISRTVLVLGAGFAFAAALTGCTVEVQNRQAAQELAQASKPPGSVYTGWRVFQEKCARCHGPAATGGEGPNLLPIVGGMSSSRFVGLVLTRYDWALPATQANSTGAAREALIDSVVQRREGAIAMPEWQGEPRVNAHIADLYAYLVARSNGAQGTGRPVQ